jgi:integrase
LRLNLHALGPWGRRVRVFVEPVGRHRLVRVQWRADGRILTRSWRDSEETRVSAVKLAQALIEGTVSPDVGQPLTLDALWERYAAAEFPGLRERSREIYRSRWALWIRAAGGATRTDLVTARMLDRMVEQLRADARAPNQIRMVIDTVRIVFRWARSRALLEHYPFEFYRFKLRTGEVPAEIAEFRLAEASAILGELDPDKSTQWRAWALLNLIAHQGVRANAALHLRWDDIDSEADLIRWPARFDKLGRTWEQPIREPSRRSLEVARSMRQRNQYAGPWLFYSSYKRGRASDEDVPYSIQSLYSALKGAERRAGVPHKDRRGLHGFRRMVAGEVFEATRDVVATMEFLGDRDIAMAQRYIKRRLDRVRWVARAVDAENRSAT